MGRAVSIGVGIALFLTPLSLTSASASKAKSNHKSSSKLRPVVATCPTASQISKAAGSTYPAPKSNSGGGLVSCNYSNPTTGANLVLEYEKIPGASASILKTTAQSQAKAQGVSAKSISGYGSAAYITTLHDAGTNSDGIATTILEYLDGSTFVDITAEATPTSVKAIAHYLLSR
jgi:hypothetical protein